MGCREDLLGLQADAISVECSKIFSSMSQLRDGRRTKFFSPLVVVISSSAVVTSQHTYVSTLWSVYQKNNMIF